MSRSLIRMVNRSSPVEVGRVREQPAVGGDVHGAEREELRVARDLVPVEQDLLAGNLAVGGRRLVAVHLHPAADRVLLPLDRAGVVPVPAAPRRHAQVGLQSAIGDLLKDCLPQRFQVRGTGLGVLVLGPQIPKHLVVALVPQPLVVVDKGVAVVRTFTGFLGRDRRVQLGHASDITASAGSAHPGCRRVPDQIAYVATTGAWSLQRSAYVGARWITQSVAAAARAGEAIW